MPRKITHKYDNIRTAHVATKLVDTYNANRHNEALLQFMTKNASSVTDAVGTVSYWDDSRKNDHMLVAIRYSDNTVTIKLSVEQFLYFMGFRRNDKNIWLYPENDSKVKAFRTHIKYMQ